jgi:predicted TIM-barrel fold metal-dependent hydrolase
MNGSWLEWPMHTARTIFSLMANGVTRELPGLRWIFSHSGGVAPLLITRLSGFVAWDSVGPQGLRTLFPDGIEAEFRKLYFEIAQGFAPGNIEALMKLVPSSHIVFGSDYPFFSVGHTANGLETLKLSRSVKRGIERDNIRSLVPSLG